MREQLIQYVNLLFAGAPDSEDMRSEILQNTLDRYDDLVDQGKSPEAAYRLAISGIGDVNEILGTVPGAKTEPLPMPSLQHEDDGIKRRKTRAAAIALYIVCAFPLLILSDVGFASLGLCLTLAIVAAATYLMIITGRENDSGKDTEEVNAKKEAHPMKEHIGNIISVAGLVVYFVISISTGAWYITWLLFPIMACARGLSNAIIDLKEACK